MNEVGPELSGSTHPLHKTHPFVRGPLRGQLRRVLHSDINTYDWASQQVDTLPEESQFLAALSLGQKQG
jgi:hypothetical protein